MIQKIEEEKREHCPYRRWEDDMSILRFSIFRWLYCCDSITQCKRLFFFWLIILLQEKIRWSAKHFEENSGDFTFDFEETFWGKDRRFHLWCGGLAALERSHEAAKSDAGEDEASCDQNCILPSQRCDQPEILKIISSSHIWVMTEAEIIWSEWCTPIPVLWSACNSKGDHIIWQRQEIIWSELLILIPALWSAWKAVISLDSKDDHLWQRQRFREIMQLNADPKIWYSFIQSLIYISKYWFDDICTATMCPTWFMANFCAEILFRSNGNWHLNSASPPLQPHCTDKANSYVRWRK